LLRLLLTASSWAAAACPMMLPSTAVHTSVKPPPSRDNAREEWRNVELRKENGRVNKTYGMLVFKRPPPLLQMQDGTSMDAHTKLLSRYRHHHHHAKPQLCYVDRLPMQIRFHLLWASFFPRIRNHNTLTQTTVPNSSPIFKKISMITNPHKFKTLEFRKPRRILPSSDLQVLKTYKTKWR
jgi:hypothetical protein